MEIVNYSKLRQNLKKYLDEVGIAGEPIAVYGAKGASVAIVPYQEYQDQIDRTYLLDNTVNFNAIMDAIQQLDISPNKRIVTRDIDQIAAKYHDILKDVRTLADDRYL